MSRTNLHPREHEKKGIAKWETCPLCDDLAYTFDGGLHCFTCGYLSRERLDAIYSKQHEADIEASADEADTQADIYDDISDYRLCQRHRTGL